ncbi:MAG: trypsin-like peptidase domain-containing protein [Deltaproteobacteria bacterium]|nr:trypsin-like peptidase domain-containing protein [Deltaproteobacteria bacterium]
MAPAAHAVRASAHGAAVAPVALPEHLAPPAESAKRRLIGRHIAPPTLSAAHWQRIDTPDGPAWRALVRADGAAFLRPRFEVLPNNVTSVFVYAPGEAPIAVSPRRDAPFWGPIVEGDRAFIEAQTIDGRLPALRLAGLSYGTVPFWVPQKEQSCNIETSCHPEWADEASGVALITFEEHGNTYLCTGSLVTDISHTMTPYFLTANHCLSDQAAAESLVAYWYYQTPTCGGSVPSLQNVPLSEGADFLAGGALSDYTLMLLHEAPPTERSFLGWSTDPLAGGEEITVIHHPGGAHKRITFGNMVNGFATHWTVRYYEGSTEGGSSGSPLFNAGKQIVGQLTGGSAACFFMFGSDRFGKFALSWDNGLADILGVEVTTTTTVPATTTTSTIPDPGDDDDATDDDADGMSDDDDDEDDGACCG